MDPPEKKPAEETDSEEEAGEEAEADVLRLVGMGRCQGVIYKLKPGEQKTLGRGDFGEKKLSGSHCAIKYEGRGRATVTDLSKNGCFVNKKSIVKGAPTQLDNGDLLSLLHPSKTTDTGNLEFMVNTPVLIGSKRKNTTEALTDPPAKKPSFDTTPLVDSLTCGICTDILYKPVSCLPCLHNFCSPCYSEWLGVNSTGICPCCRGGVTELRRNHSLQSAVDALLASKPSLKRTDSQIEDLEKKNKITDESLRIAKKAKHGVEEYGEEEEEEEEEGEEFGDDGGMSANPFLLPIPGGFNIGNLNFGLAFASQADHCRECDTPSPSGHQCHPVQKNHLRCTSCNQNFPNRPEKTQRCDVCRKPFCNEYWGCPGPNGGGSFKPLKDQSFDHIPPHATFAGNPFEIAILTKWMSEQSKTPQALWELCLEKLASKEWAPHGIICNTPSIQAENFSCGWCAAKIFGGLLYHFRRGIPASELPDGVGQRSDCWYGLECRTQHNKPAHAANLNHVCPKTRG